MEEMLDTYDINGKLLKPQTRAFCHSENPMCYHKAVWIWIINDKNEFLVQKRSHLKRTAPNKWDMPVAGHVDAGETLLQTCVRETKEELGLDVKESDFIFLTEMLKQKSWEFAEIYLLRTTAKIEDFTLQKEEVSKVEYLPYDEFIRLLYSTDFAPHEKDYKDWVSTELKKCIGV